MKDRFKFRAWIAKYKKLVDVFRYGNDLGTCEWIWHSHIYDTPDGKPVLDNWGSVDERFSNIIERTKLIDCVLEQCTGLKDKNGKLIYEGDIVKKEFKNKPFSSKAKTKEKLIKIKWNDVEACFSFDFLNEKDKHDNFQCWESVWGHKYSNDEVIGNIHTENINDM